VVLEAKPVYTYLGSRAFGTAGDLVEMVVGFGLAGAVCAAATVIPVTVALRRLERLER
jgi:hypothetical protein